MCIRDSNQTTGKWGPNLQCYKERLHDHPERISNLYFNYALVLRAIGKLKDHIQDYTFCSGDPYEDRYTKELVTLLSRTLPEGPEIFDERIMFQDQGLIGTGITLKEDFRNRFRNVSRIMDCVGCDKCRLWGKLQTAGYGMALKVLFELGNGDANAPKALLRRTELVALINTLDKISHALKAIQEFRAMIAAETSFDNIVLPKDVIEEKKIRGEVDEEDEDDVVISLNDLNTCKVSPGQPTTVMEAFGQEFGRFMKAFKYIIGSWVAFPGTL